MKDVKRLKVLLKQAKKDVKDAKLNYDAARGYREWLKDGIEELKRKDKK